MPPTTPIATTQRAYTLRLAGADKNDTAWRDALWATHEAVNRGAKAFGDWLLTLRGGLCHTLADMKVPAAKGKPERDPTPQEKRDRRILLALSWLSVEDAHGVEQQHERRSKNLGHECYVLGSPVDALRQILQTRGLLESEIDAWVADCRSSLEARIRDDAVWCNRSLAFDRAVQRINLDPLRVGVADGNPDQDRLTRKSVWDVFEKFFVSPAAYLALPKPSENEDGEEAEAAKEEKEKDLVQKAGQWLSARFGEGKGADFETMGRVYTAIAAWAKAAPADTSGAQALTALAQALASFEPESQDLPGVLALISGPGYKSATRNLLERVNDKDAVEAADLAKLAEQALVDVEKCAGKTGGKGRRAWADAILKEVEEQVGFSYSGGPDNPARHKEFSVMLDHAARRVVIAHSWIRRAEVERAAFEKDAAGMAAVPADARQWLDAFCRTRGESTGGDYRIRLRAIDGWREVVARWSRPECDTEAKRIEAARDLQSELEKFGDVQLFEALAPDSARCTWQTTGSTDADLLTKYVRATNAEFLRRRFKVPAYRHPDPLRHPVFCDFGNSRWSIVFQMLENAKLGKKRKKQVEAHPRDVRIKLWTGDAVKERTLRWRSKRLAHDLSPNGDAEQAVSRADRLGRAAAGASASGPVQVFGLFQEKEWNGRLQAPRRQLDELAAHLDRNNGQWDKKAERMRNHLHWLVSFSARLHTTGPWADYAAAHDLLTDPKYMPHAAENKGRAAMAKLILSRLPALRVLSVDLGHRYAAACAVWETVPAADLHKLCAEKAVAPPAANDLFFYIPDGKRRHLYRRVGADTLPDGKLHPAPWARLDRQFLVKLQGEDETARFATPAERADVERFERDLGIVDKPRKPADWRIDSLMSDCVRSARLAIRRLGDYARVANGFLAKERFERGRVQPVPADKVPDVLTGALMTWARLAASDRYPDAWAKDQWDAIVVKRFDGPPLTMTSEEETGAQRRAREANLEKSLTPLAQRLATQDRMPIFRDWEQRWGDMNQPWPARLRWLRRWILPRGKKGQLLRQVGGLSLNRIATIRSLYQVQKAYRYKPEPSNLRAGVTLIEDDSTKGYKFGDRALQAMERLREQRVKQFASRLVEAALGVGSEDRKHWEGGKRPRQRIAEPRFAPCHAIVIENLTHYRPEEHRTRRENRQLMTWSAAKVKKYLAEGCQLHGLHLREVSPNYTSRQDSRTGAPGLRCNDIPVTAFIAPCWAVRQATRSLTKDMPDGATFEDRYQEALKSAREGKGAANDRYFVELFARWDAKQRQWTDFAGVRWTLQAGNRWEAVPRQEGTPTWGKKHKAPQPVRVIEKGGDLFVSTSPCSEAAVLQADLNAAANIGLRALFDPDFPGRWWYVPCALTRETGQALPVVERIKGAACFPDPARFGSLTGVKEPAGKPKRGGKQGAETVNFWTDPSARPLRNHADGGFWLPTPAYWKWVQRRVLTVLRALNGLEPTPAAEPEAADDETPF